MMPLWLFALTHVGVGVIAGCFLGMLVLGEQLDGWHRDMDGGNDGD